MKQISVDLWFDANAEEAVDFYTSVFPGSKRLNSVDYGPNSMGAEGTVMYVQFELNGQLYGAVNGGPHFTFNEAMSLVINCDDQEEIDYYWEKLSAVPESEQCGWVKDKFGVSWQIVPAAMSDWMTDQTTSNRVMAELLQMKKLDIATLEKAAAG